MTAPLSIPPCTECSGQGSFVTSDCSEVACNDCYGTGEGTPICSACQTTPDENDECGCTTRCEFCRTPTAPDLLIFGSCPSCFDAAYARCAEEMGEAAING